jgi:hypothetical protein
MEQGFDLRVESFQARLAALINNADLPTSMIMYILKDYYNQIYTLYQKNVDRQYAEFCEEANKEKEQEQNNNEEKAE